MEPIGIENDDIHGHPGFESLGPAYYSARRMAEKIMAGAEPLPFREVADECLKEIQGRVYDYVENYLIGDLEINIQGHVARMVDDTVQALLTGQQWAMDRYPYHAYSRGEEVRAAVAKHGGERLLMARIADLEKRMEQLKQSLDWSAGR